MDILKAQFKVHNLMKDHQLYGWTFKWDNAKRRFGSCNSTKKKITLSMFLTKQRTEKEVTNTILHEIAHAIVGAKHGHDRVWRAKALEIGCDGQRCSDGSNIKMDYKYLGTCPNGHEHKRLRKARGNQSCGSCSNSYNERYLITWKQVR